MYGGCSCSAANAEAASAAQRSAAFMLYRFFSRQRICSLHDQDAHVWQWRWQHEPHAVSVYTKDKDMVLLSMMRKGSAACCQRAMQCCSAC